jgi:phage terminase large subunit-like protein
MSATSPRAPRKRSATISRSAEPHELKLFADKFCPALILENDQPFKLYPAQRQMLAAYFDGVRESLILIPKKNGKTTLLAALALYHLTTVPDAACFIAAASRDQATILFDQARGFIRRSDWLSSEVDVKAGYRQIRSTRDSGLIRVLAADADTADGVLPTLGLVDELHRHKSADLYGIFRDGLGPRNGQMITISTAGEDEESPLGKLRAAAYGLGVKRDGAYRHVRVKGFAMHEWALSATDDLHDIELVKSANPAPWQTVKALRERHDSPSMTPWGWARFATGVWGVGVPRAFDPDVWASIADPGVPIEAGRKVVLGFDGARRKDTTGLVAVDIETGHMVVAGFWERPTSADDDWEISEDDVDQAVAYAFETWDVWRLYGDPPYWETALDRWAALYRVRGKDRVARWWTNRIKAMALTLRQFRGDMVPGRMSHDGDPALALHIGNAVIRETRMSEDGEPLWTIAKESRSSPNKIDLAMAAALAWNGRGHAISDGVLQQRSYARAAW